MVFLCALHAVQGYHHGFRRRRYQCLPPVTMAAETAPTQQATDADVSTASSSSGDALENFVSGLSDGGGGGGSNDANGRRTYTPRVADQGGAGGGSTGRVYTPRAAPGAGAGMEQQPPRVYQGTGPRVYKPRGDASAGGAGAATATTYQPRGSSSSGGGSFHAAGAGGGGGGGGGDSTISLSMPQLLIRFRVPRVKSELKVQLETMQDMFKEQAEAGRGSRDYGGYSSGGRSSYGGGDRFGGGGADSFDALFAQSSATKKKDAKGKAAARDDDGNWGGEGGKPKSSSRRTKEEGVEDDEVEYEEDEADEEAEDDSTYYGDETNRSLSSVSAADLQTMEREGYSLEEIQLTLYGEYGVKASISAIRKRLMEDKSEKKGKKRTGKTRRDRTKARNARHAPVVDQGIVLPEGSLIQIVELARLMEVGGGEVVKHLMINMGIMASMTQSIEISVAKQVITAFGKTLAQDGADEEGDEEDDEDDDDDDSADEVTMDGEVVERLARPPVVTIMGHVDHGKTTLLDSIRKTQVALGEAGGITQGISAFKVKTGDDSYVTFIDTPGHAAFSEMRKRGANVTDIVILVVAADDGIMEQTKECIAAAKAANCPIVVAVNKIDKEGADVEKVLTGLMSYDILTEEFGGEVQCAKVSAKAGVGIDDLLEKVLVQAEIMNLRSAYHMAAEGTVIEARVDKGMGVIVTALVQKGTLKIGDYVLAGPSWGRVRRLIGDSRNDMTEAGPSTPVQIVGMSTVPNAGDVFSVTMNEAAAREVAEARQRLARQAAGSQSSASIMAQALGFAEGVADRREVLKVPLLLKADVSGSVEAIRSAIDQLQMSDEDAMCKADIVYAGVGDVTSSDVAVAAAAKAKVVAFNVASGFNAMEDARATNVQIGYYNVVYDLLDELEAVIKSTLAPPPPGTLVGKAEIKKVFKLGKVGKVAGCMVIDGMIKADSQVRVMRGKRNPIYTGTLSSLKVVKDSVQEVPNGSECGMSFDDGFSDFEEGDIVECFVGGEGDDSEGGGNGGKNV